MVISVPFSAFSGAIIFTDVLLAKALKEKSRKTNNDKIQVMICLRFLLF